MAISFKEIFGLNIPFVQAELIRNSIPTGTIKQEYTALIFGQQTAAGIATEGEVLDIFSKGEAQTKFGKTSMLAHAVGRYFDNNTSVKLKVIPLNDLVAGATATATLTITGTASAAGTLAFYVNGKAYKVPVAATDTAAAIATALKSVIDLDDEAQFTAADALGVVTLTAVHKGTYGNTLKAKMNYNADDITPADITAVVVDFAGGTGDPDLETSGVIAILEENQFNLIAQPYTDNANLTLIDTALTDNFKATDMLDGFCLSGIDDTVTNLTTKSDIINSAFITLLDNYSYFATGLEQASGMIGLVGDIAQSNPGIDYLNKILSGFLPLDERIREERNVLAGGGIATVRTQGTTVIIERTVTTLQKDAQAVPIDIDDTDLRVFLTISYVRYTFVVRMSAFQGYKVGNDADIFGAGAQVMTPNLYKQNLILNYAQLVSDAVCEDLDGFIDSVVVEKVGNRMDSTMQIDVINVLLQQGMQINWKT